MPGNSPTLCQPCANPSPDLRQPFLPTPLQAPLSVGPRHPFRNAGQQLLVRGLEEGLAGGGWRRTGAKIQRTLIPRIMFPFSQGWHRQRAQKRGLNLWHRKELLAPTPSGPLPANPFSKLLILGNRNQIFVPGPVGGYFFNLKCCYH